MMIKKNLSKLVVALSFGSLLGACASVSERFDEALGQADQVAAAKALLAAFQSGDPAALELISDETYIQHNVNFPSGKAAIAGFFGGEPTGIEVETVRSFEDGDTVVLHSLYSGAWNNGTPQVAFDVFRFDGGKIVEHWDNLGDEAAPNPSGRTQLDGSTEVTDLALGESNKELVRAFVQTVLVDGEYEQLPRWYSSDILQHNSQVADGIDGLQKAVTEMAANGVTMTYDTIHHLWGQGNFVLVVSEGAFGGAPVSFYDLFRVADGMIVEHWDVIENLTEDANRAGDAAKF